MLLNGQSHHQEDGRGLHHKALEDLPVAIKKVLCEQCRNSYDGSSWRSQLADLLPVKVVYYLLTVLILPIKLILFYTKSMILSCSALICRQSIRGDDPNRQSPEQHRSSSSSDSDLSHQTGNIQTSNSTIASTSNRNLHHLGDNQDLLSLISTSTVSPAAVCGKVTLNTVVNRRMHNQNTL